MDQEEKAAYNKKTRPLLIVLVIIAVIVVFYLGSRSNGETSSTSINSESSQDDTTNQELLAAIEAYDKDDYKAAMPVFEKNIQLGSKDGELWYRYAFTKLKVTGKVNVMDFLQSWSYLTKTNKDSPYVGKAVNQIKNNLNYFVYELKDTDIGINSVKASTFIGDPNFGVKASEGAIFIQIIHSIKNKSNEQISIFNIPGITLYGPENVKYERDGIKSGLYNAQIDNPVDGGINPGIKKNLANIFEVPASEWEKGGWYIKIDRDKAVPIK